MAGPGTELKRIIPSVMETPSCKCGEFAEKMDGWGVDGCERRFDYIVEHLVFKAKRNKILGITPSAAVRVVATSWVRKAIDRAAEKA